MLGNRNSVLGNEQKATFIHTQFAHVYALIFMCTHTHTHIFTFPYACVCGKITIFISDGSRVCLLRTLRIVCVGSLSKANSEIKAHKFILANCWNKRKKERKKAKWSENLRGIIFLGVLTELLAWLSVNKMHICLVAFLPRRLPTTIS